MTNIQCNREARTSTRSSRREAGVTESSVFFFFWTCRVLVVGTIPAGRQCRRMPTRSCCGTAAADEAIRGVLRIVSELLTSVGRPTKEKQGEGEGNGKGNEEEERSSKERQGFMKINHRQEPEAGSTCISTSHRSSLGGAH